MWHFSEDNFQAAKKGNVQIKNNNLKYRTGLLFLSKNINLLSLKEVEFESLCCVSGGAEKDASADCFIGQSCRNHCHYMRK